MQALLKKVAVVGCIVAVGAVPFASSATAAETTERDGTSPSQRTSGKFNRSMVAMGFVYSGIREPVA
jgi:hypothetical protein